MSSPARRAFFSSPAFPHTTSTTCKGTQQYDVSPFYFGLPTTSFARLESFSTSASPRSAVDEPQDEPLPSTNQPNDDEKDEDFLTSSSSPMPLYLPTERDVPKVARLNNFSLDPPKTDDSPLGDSSSSPIENETPKFLSPLQQFNRILSLRPFSSPQTPLGGDSLGRRLIFLLHFEPSKQSSLRQILETTASRVRRKFGPDGTHLYHPHSSVTGFFAVRTDLIRRNELQESEENNGEEMFIQEEKFFDSEKSTDRSDALVSIEKSVRRRLSQTLKLIFIQTRTDLASGTSPLCVQLQRGVPNTVKEKTCEIIENDSGYVILPLECDEIQPLVDAWTHKLVDLFPPGCLERYRLQSRENSSTNVDLSSPQPSSPASSLSSASTATSHEGFLETIRKKVSHISLANGRKDTTIRRGIAEEYRQTLKAAALQNVSWDLVLYELEKESCHYEIEGGHRFSEVCRFQSIGYTQ